MRAITGFLLICFFCTFLSCCLNTQKEDSNHSPNQNQEGESMAKLIINFVLRYDETSKDSNSSTVNIAVSNKKVRIVKEYDGFGAPENEKLEKELSDELLKLIMDYLKEHQLNKNLKELKETKDIGIAGFLKIKVFKPDTTFIQIEGKTNIWGSDEYIEKNWGSEFVKSQTNIENMEYFDRAKSFVNFIEGL